DRRGPATVARGILQLRADLRERLVLPRHGQRREAPLGMTGNSRRVEVRFLMTGRAPHRADTVTVVAALHRWLVRIAGSLRWPVAVRMAVLTARMSEHLSRFAEESCGARRRIADGSKFAGGPKREPLAGMRHRCD